jgi:hypothetical protein
MAMRDLAWPQHDVDHIDPDKANNRLPNLRHATRLQNIANTGVRKDNALGVKGVARLSSGKYAARITKNDKRVHLGTRATIEEAAALYLAAARELHGTFARAA